MSQSQHDIEQRCINEEYKLWRKNVPHNYDFLVTHALAWPSLSVEWFPTAIQNSDSTTQHILLSTHTSGKDEELLTIASVTIPDEITDAALEKYHNNFDNYGESKIKIEQEIPVAEEINRTRYCPFSINVIAVRSDDPDVFIYDTTKHKIKSSKSDVVSPNLVLSGHSKGGYGLSWSNNFNGYLLTSGDDGNVCLFDINKDHETGADKIGCLSKYSAHETVVGDCGFSFYDANRFVSVGDDRRVAWYDIREGKCVFVKEDAHASDIFCVAYSPIEDNLVATGSKDGQIHIWDERNREKPIYVFDTGSDNEVLQIQWSPHQGNLIASSGTNRRVCIWDICRVGVEQSEEEKMDGPPELLFLHAGHTNYVCDLSWNPLQPLEIATVAEDNIIQIWQMTCGDLPCDIND